MDAQAHVQVTRSWISKNMHFDYPPSVIFVVLQEFYIHTVTPQALVNDALPLFSFYAHQERPFHTPHAIFHYFALSGESLSSLSLLLCIFLILLSISFCYIHLLFLIFLKVILFFLSAFLCSFFPFFLLSYTSLSPPFSLYPTVFVLPFPLSF